ncbi:RHS domain-containing protein [Budviciaceae bacterium CWB-B4]|uniref:RHS domain-containing protein n=1 Tax=Limnobaculum xujianqingii TaxID=2738837 RepID=A0A9D7AG72_9GAMM|nr:RHS repeat-associated core domain-containing protein [Limnobaculum xujianqingii]MBK5072187.1 RHS domain-containing protein [Limnobaculum xujianqingii]MBK5175496.1 RHS domain-containing protein [Limnobaculum xujianqingii]
MSLLASTHLSPVVGVDVHMVNVPAPAPIPHPHVGLVLDFREMVNGAKSFVGSLVMNFVQENVPAEIMEKVGQAQEAIALANAIRSGDLKSAAGQVGGKIWNSEAVQGNPMVKSALGAVNSVKDALGAGVGQGGGSDRPVLVNNLLRATVGTNSRHIPGLHFPLGAGYAQKLPSCDAEAFMGSKTVIVNGDPFSYLALPSLSCWFVGMLPIKKNGAHTERRELSLPTAVTLPIPVGRPVLVGGPPTLNFLAIALALFKAFRGSKLAKKLFSKLPPGFVKCKIFDAEPVNSITGEVIVQQNDFEVDGRLPLIWDRYYSGHQAYDGAIGHIWLTPADIHLSLVVTEGILGAFAQFPDHKTAFEMLPAYEGWEHHSLDWQQGHAIYRLNNELILRTREGVEYHFPLPGDWQHRVEQLKEDEQLSLWFSRMEDLNGNGWRFERDKQQHLQQLVEYCLEGDTGRQITCHYEGRYLTDLVLYESAADNTGVLLAGYRQNNHGDMVSVLDAHQQSYDFEYIDNHQMVRHTDRNGLSFYYAYTLHEDQIQRVHRAWGDHGLFDYAFAYHPERQETLITDSLGHTTILQYDERQLPLVRIDPLGGVKSYQYDGQQRGISEIDPGGNKTEWEYDQRANIVSRRYPDGSGISIRYDEKNKPIEIVDAENQRWQQQWNDNGNLISQKTPLGQESWYSYDMLGQLVEVHSGQQQTKLTYDELGFIRQLQDIAGRVTDFQFDRFGHLQKRRLANGDETRYQYDKKGRLTSCQLEDGEFISCRYDHEDNLIEYRDRGKKVTKFAYFGQGRLSQQTLPDGNSLQYHYNTEEQLIGVTNQRGERWQLNRDAVGRLIEERDYWGKARSYHYDEAGYLTQSLNPLGQLLAVTCDRMGRIVSKVPQGQPEKTETYAYNKRGQLTLAKNQHSEVTRQYNQVGMLILENQQQQDVTARLEYVYNLSGQLSEQHHQLRHHSQSKETAFNQALRFEYNELGQLIRQQVDDHAPIEFGFDEIGRLTSQKQSEAVTSTFEYTKTGQLKRQSLHRSGSTHSDSIDYHYDVSGNLVMRSDSRGGTDRYFYDVLGQITRHSNPMGEIHDYVYNANGDRFVEKENPEGQRELTFNDGMQYRLNQAGQLIVREDGERSDRLEWDENECLSGFYRTGERGERYQYHYDALRRRIRKTCIDMRDRVEKITYFIWDGDALTAEVSFSPVATGANAKLDSRFFIYYLNTFEPLVLQCKQQGIGSLAPPEEIGYYFYQNDPNGMPLRLYDAQGEIAWSAHYTAFGRVDQLDEIKVKQPLRLQGQYFDEESGLHYNRHRYYDPRTGIFVCQDPIGLLGGINPYYLAPNILGWIDPLGLAKKTNESGTYSSVGGHHVHAKAGFKNEPNYDIGEAFAIGQDYMKEKGWDHQAMTNAQRQGFKELSESGRPNTLAEHDKIAKDALMAGGATEEEADDLVGKSKDNLTCQNVSKPSNIPWYS